MASVGKGLAGFGPRCFERRREGVCAEQTTPKYLSSDNDPLFRFQDVVVAYCTVTFPGFFDSDETLSSVIEKIRSTGRQHPACALLDELDGIHRYSQARNQDVADPQDLRELTDFVRRTLKIVNAIPNLP